MTARPLPPPENLPLRVVSETIDAEPAVHRHKMLNYWSRRMAFERARQRGADEALLIGPGGSVLEGSRNSVIVVPKGGRTVVSPSLDAPILPGVMRRVALDFAAGLGYRVEERAVGRDELFAGAAVFLTNAVRGVRPVREIDGRAIRVDDALARLFVEDFVIYLLNQAGADT